MIEHLLRRPFTAHGTLLHKHHPVGYLTGSSNVRMTIKNEDGTPVNPGDLLRGYNPIELE